jgi:hypothetical protein
MGVLGWSVPAQPVPPPPQQQQQQPEGPAPQELVGPGGELEHAPVPEPAGAQAAAVAAAAAAAGIQRRRGSQQAQVRRLLGSCWPQGRLCTGLHMRPGNWQLLATCAACLL